MNPIERYFSDLFEIRSSGASVPETSFYPALSQLLNETGKGLKPRVRCILQLANRGAGNPDGGLFTANQLRKNSDASPIPGQPPERGVIEIKPPTEDAWVTASGPQVSKYWGKYGLVLVTNYRDFVLVGRDATGKPVKLETYRLASSSTSFWDLAKHPRRAAQLHEPRFTEYLKRMMLHAAPLTAAEDVAWFLASYARDAASRIENSELEALTAVRKALEEALGLKFHGTKGEHFFRSTLIQTLFYGVFSAWVLWSKENPPNGATAKFDWKQAAWFLHVPMIRALFEQVAAPTKLKSLGLVEPLDWASMTLTRVDRKAFFSTFDEGHAVQYFYEPFLQQFDPELRKELGVWYTPPEVVKYMVARVDAELREELNIADGLADSRVYVLDPCCGTGSYLVEVLRSIAATLEAKGGDALVGQDLKKAAMQRVFGFEIMPAPFVVAHLQLGLLLQQLHAPLSHGSSERVGVYLTNALTGWQPPKGPKQHLMFPELEEERDAAEEVKRERPILVILGNPPYNAFAGVSPAEEEGLVDVYKEDLNTPVSRGGWGIKKFNLDDLYIRFFRVAERRVVDGTPGEGVVCFISNLSYLADPSFVVTRHRFLREFDALWFDCMNGDSRETGKVAPDGSPDPSVFSTQYHPVGIRVGTAIALMVRASRRAKTPLVRYRDFWGTTKRTDLLDSVAAVPFDASYTTLAPSPENRYSFRPVTATKTYLAWPSLEELVGSPPMLGLLEKRRSALFAIRREELETRLRRYGDAQVPWEALGSEHSGLTTNAARFDARKTRARFIASGGLDPSAIRRIMVRPMDYRWCYYSSLRPLWNEPRPTLVAQTWKGNGFIVTRNKAVASVEGVPFYFTGVLGDEHAFHKDAYYIPLMLKKGPVKKGESNAQPTLFKSDHKAIPNLSEKAKLYLSRLCVTGSEDSSDAARLIWMHTLAIGYSSSYLEENRSGVRQKWPRIPLPDSKALLEESAELGEMLAALLDTEKVVSGVTGGTIRSELKHLGVLSRQTGGSLNPDVGDLDLKASWGHLGKGGVNMAGAGKLIKREYSTSETEAIAEGVFPLDLTLRQAVKELGGDTRDVYLNGVAYWRNIPASVWEYTIGGYQVMKKWLSYREYEILGRGLTIEEARELTNMVRRIAAILLLQPLLDKNYQAAKSSTFGWPPTTPPA